MAGNINTEILPTAFIDKVSLFSKEQNDTIENTKVELKISLKSQKNDIFLKFLNKDLDDYLSINILQVVDKNLQAFLSISKELVYYAALPNTMPNKLPLIILQIAYNNKIISNNPVESNRQILTAQLKEIFQQKISKQILSDLPVLRSIKKSEKLESGEEVISTFFNVNFEVPASPEHLSYFIFSDYDKDKISQEFGVEFESLNEIKISSDIVINDYKIVSQTYGYYLEDGSIWTGYLHYDGADNMWKTGNLEDESGKMSLRRSVFYNTKIQDFRIFNKIIKQQFQFEKMNEDLLIKLQKFYYRPNKIDPIEFENVLSDGIEFSINLESLLKKHSRFYNFLSLIDLNNADWIYDIKTYRKRVKVSSEENKEIIVSPFKKNSTQTTVNNRLENLEEGILTISIQDPQIENDLYLGNYAYGVKIFFKDPLLPILQQQLLELQKNDRYAYLKGYYNLSTLTTTGQVEGNYDPLLGKFTEKFILEQNVASEQQKRQISVETFMEAYNKINTSQISIESDIIVSIFKQIHPNTGTPEGILNFIKLYETIIGVYKMLIGTSNTLPLYVEEKYFEKQKSVIEARRKQTERRPLGSLTFEQDSVSNMIKEMAEKYSITISKVKRKKEPIRKGNNVSLTEELINTIEQDEQKSRENENISTPDVLVMTPTTLVNLSSALLNTFSIIENETRSIPLRSRRKKGFFNLAKNLKKIRIARRRNRIENSQIEEIELITTASSKPIFVDKEDRQKRFRKIIKKVETSNRESEKKKTKIKQKISDIDQTMNNSNIVTQNNQVSNITITQINNIAIKQKTRQQDKEIRNKKIKPKGRRR